MRPTAGVECRRCREEKQHKCQAQIFVDAVPLCLPCADDLPCTVDRVGLPVPIEVEWEEGIHAADREPAPVIHRTPEDLGLPAVVMEAPALPGQVKANAQKACAEAAQLHAAVERRAKGGKKSAPFFASSWAGSPERQAQHLRNSHRSMQTTVRAKVAARAARTPHFKPEELLGTRIDREVAEQTGVTVSRVAQLREEQGISAVAQDHSHPRRFEIRGEEVLMSPKSVMGAEMIAPEREQTMVDDVEQEILKHAGRMTDDEAGKKAGVSNGRVWQIRKKHGIPRFTGKREAKPKKTTALLKPCQRTVDILDAAAKSGIDALIGADNVRVTIDLTPAQARSHFEKLTPAQMAIALGAVLQSSLREG
jgi:hypothetical protein